MCSLVFGGRWVFVSDYMWNFPLLGMRNQKDEDSMIVLRFSFKVHIYPSHFVEQRYLNSFELPLFIFDFVCLYGNDVSISRVKRPIVSFCVIYIL